MARTARYLSLSLLLVVLLALASACSTQRRGGMSMPRKMRKKCDCPKWTEQRLQPRELTYVHG